jgi:hypothetical protein
MVANSLSKIGGTQFAAMQGQNGCQYLSIADLPLKQRRILPIAGNLFASGDQNRASTASLFVALAGDEWHALAAVGGQSANSIPPKCRQSRANPATPEMLRTTKAFIIQQEWLGCCSH